MSVSIARMGVGETRAGWTGPPPPRSESIHRAPRRATGFADRQQAEADTPAPAYGYVGLQQSLARLPASAAATLLTALIHSMGGAATSVARGMYLNTLA